MRFAEAAAYARLGETRLPWIIMCAGTLFLLVRQVLPRASLVVLIASLAVVVGGAAAKFRTVPEGPEWIFAPFDVFLSFWGITWRETLRLGVMKAILSAIILAGACVRFSRVLTCEKGKRK
mgnify:CR=1 FL=1